MSKFCPIRKEKVIYLECLECEDRECEHPSDEEDKEEPDRE